MATQTRQEHYDECKKAYEEAAAAGKPLPPMPEAPVKAGPGIASQDVNGTDVRDYDDATGMWGPWRRAEG